MHAHASCMHVRSQQPQWLNPEISDRNPGVFPENHGELAGLASRLLGVLSMGRGKTF